MSRFKTGLCVVLMLSCSHLGASEPKPKSKEKSKPKKQITNSVGMKMVLIPAGEFLMGSPKSEKYRETNEGPQHKVKITKPFYMATTEVTQKQWKAVMGTTPWGARPM